MTGLVLFLLKGFSLRIMKQECIMANPLIPIGQSLVENCPKCRAKVNGRVDEKHHANFLCPICNHSWNYHIYSQGKGSKFTIDIDELLKRNPQLSINRDDFKQKP